MSQSPPIRGSRSHLVERLCKTGRPVVPVMSFLTILDPECLVDNWHIGVLFKGLRSYPVGQIGVHRLTALQLGAQLGHVVVVRGKSLLELVGSEFIDVQRLVVLLN